MAQIFLVHSLPEVQQAFADALKDSSEHKLVGVARTSAEGLAKVPAAAPDIAFIQLELIDGDGFALIAQLAKKNPKIYPVPVLKGAEGAEAWQKILRMNLRDVLAPPITRDAILKACQDAGHNALAYAEQFQTAGGVGHQYMVSVTSARGGVGKTLFATNLAIAMARLKARPLLLDYSMSAGDFFTVLDQVPRHTVADVISQGSALDGSLLRNLLSDHSLGFQFLACPNDDFDFYSFDYEQARAALRICRELAEYCIVDTGVYDLPTTNAAVDEADLTFVLTSRDLARLMATQRLIKSFKSRGIELEKIKVIVNNAEVGSEITEAEIEEVLQHDVTAYLPSIASEATFSINSGKPMMHNHADHPMCAVIARIAEYTLDRWEQPA